MAFDIPASQRIPVPCQVTLGVTSAFDILLITKVGNRFLVESLPPRLLLRALQLSRSLYFSEPMNAANVLAAAPASVIKLSPPAQAFVDNKVTSLGTWIIGAALECILMGVVFCQTEHYFRNQRREAQFWTYTTSLVLWVLVLSMLKTTQVVKIIWEQNVIHFANPDVAMVLLATAWWQTTAPVMTGIIGFTVQSFYTLRFFRLTRNYFYTALIVCAMVLGIVGGGMAEHYIAKAMVKEKLRWFLIHFTSVTIADVLITIGTVTALYRRNTVMTNVIQRLTRLMFEAAIPPAVIATTDLILTQLYVISLLYTLNSIGDNRQLPSRDTRMTSGNTHPSQIRFAGRQGDTELQMEVKSPNGQGFDGLNETPVSPFLSKPVQPWDR
ncbi:hypothetical protein C8J57DRAFT_1620669 [Mycena rebaudengoi]|nr:hypothetical protein C8J57DRAFT_1620669 [Mycena rebaudengoi]